jgi:hypothetical protein
MTPGLWESALAAEQTSSINGKHQARRSRLAGELDQTPQRSMINRVRQQAGSYRVKHPSSEIMQ